MKFSIRKKLGIVHLEKILMIFAWLTKCHFWGHSLKLEIEKQKLEIHFVNKKL